MGSGAMPQRRQEPSVAPQETRAQFVEQIETREGVGRCSRGGRCFVFVFVFVWLGFFLPMGAECGVNERRGWAGGEGPSWWLQAVGFVGTVLPVGSSRRSSLFPLAWMGRFRRF